MDDDEQPEADGSGSDPEQGSGPVTVRVPRSADWTGYRDFEEIEAADVVAAAQWDERNWRRT